MNLYKGIIVSALLLLNVFAFAADTYTTNYGFRMPDIEVEDPITPWGTKLNLNWIFCFNISIYNKKKKAQN